MGEFRRFGHDSVGRDGSDLVSTEFCEQQVIRVPGPDDRRRGGRWKNCDGERRSDSRDLRVKSAGDPEIAIGPCGEGARSLYASELSDDSLRGDAGKFVHGLLGEPHVAI